MITPVFSFETFVITGTLEIYGYQFFIKYSKFYDRVQFATRLIVEVEQTGSNTGRNWYVPEVTSAGITQELDKRMGELDLSETKRDEVLIALLDSVNALNESCVGFRPNFIVHQSDDI